MRGRAITVDNVIQIEAGLAALRIARRAFQAAGARKTAEYVQRSIKSAEGARNHALRISDNESSAAKRRAS